MRWIKAAAAVVATGALLVLPPILLITYIGNPWPAGGISWNAPLTDGAIIGVLAVIVWVLWMQLAACVVAELFAAVRRTDSMSVPLAFGFQRDLAKWAVNSVLALSVVAPTVGFSTSVANATPVTPAPVASTTQTVAVETAPVREEQQRTATQTVAVEHLDNLYSIAQKHLGDGSRWTEIADLNKGKTMNDGSTFSNPEVIRTGWELQIPDDAVTSGAHVIERGDSLSQIALEELGDADQWPDLYDANRDVVGANPDLIFPGQQIVLPDQSSTPQVESDTSDPVTEAPDAEAEVQTPAIPDAADGQGTVQGDGQTEGDVPSDSDQGESNQALGEVEQPTAPVAATDGADVVDDDEGWPIRTTSGVGALLAAALVGLIALRRGRQQRRRPPGVAMPLPDERTETVETELRAVANVIGLDTVDRALRQVAEAADAAAERRPDVRAARLTSEQLDLYLSEPGHLHAPWTATADPSVWVLSAENVGDLEVDESAAAPYPALISLGHDEGQGVILLNLASVGRLDLAGSLAGEAFTAIALEFGSAPWAAAAQVTVVGVMAELSEALPIRYVPAMGAVDAEGSLLHDLVNATTARQQVVLAAGPLTAGQYAVLADQGVAVVTRDSAEGEWVLEVTDRDHGAVKPLDLPITPQLVDAATYAGVMASLNVSLLDPREVAAEPAQIVPFDDAGDKGADSVESEGTGKEPAAAEVLLVDELEEAGDVPSDAGEVEHIQADEDLNDVQDLQAEVATDEVLEQQHAPEAVVTVQVESIDLEEIYEIDPLLETGHPVIRLLGEKVDIVGAAEGAPGSTSHRDVCTRIAAYLAMNPTTTKQAMINGVWGGRRISDASVDSRVSNLRKWLGSHSESGEKYLPPRQLRLNEAVTTDWHIFIELVGKNPANASTVNLEQALRLVRGRPLGGEDSRDYTFAEFELIDMHSLIADVAYHLARRRYFEGAWRLADKAAAAGALIEPHWEPLWRLRLHIAHSEGRPGSVAETIDRMHARISELAEDTLVEFEPETVELIEALKSQDVGRIAQYREAL